MKQTNIFMIIFDTMFIMLLCFATLLTAMLMKGHSLGGLDYHINYPHIWHYGDRAVDLHISFSDQFGKRIEEHDRDDLCRSRKAGIGGRAA